MRAPLLKDSHWEFKMTKVSNTFATVLGHLMAIVVLLCAGVANAYETDQYTMPPAALADVGPELSQYMFTALEKAVLQIRREQTTLPREIQKLEIQLQKTPKTSSFPELHEKGTSVTPKPKTREDLTREIRDRRERLIFLKTEEGFLDVFHDQFAGRITWEENRDAVFGATLGILPFPDGKKNGQDILFDPGKLTNIYAFAGFHRIISPSYFVFSSTMRAFGIYFGVDKLGHFLSQGFQYDELYRENLAQGKSEAEAMQAAVASGVSSENGFFGKIVDGVYSNADLAANYAGFHFYQNLFRAVEINDVVLPALLEKNSAGNFVTTTLTKNNARMLLAPYFSLHFNEALNPSVLERPVRVVVRGEVRDRCPSLLAFYGKPTKISLQALRTSLQTWQGQDYGYDSENTLNLDELCF
jgi:hypothetical protein